MPKPNSSAVVPATEVDDEVAASKGPPASRARLTRERIVAAAIDLVDRDGLAGLSLRALGAALRCEPMSLYHHFPSKRHLEDAMADHALAALATEPPGHDPFFRLRATAGAYRDLARRHPRLVPLLAVHRLDTAAGLRVQDGVLALVRAAVPDDRLAAQFFRTLLRYAVGAGLDETADDPGRASAEPAPPEYVAANCPHLAAAAPYLSREWRDETFERGLDALLDAMRATASSLAVVVAPKPVIHPKR